MNYLFSRNERQLCGYLYKELTYISSLSLFFFGTRINTHNLKQMFVHHQIGI